MSFHVSSEVADLVAAQLQDDEGFEDDWSAIKEALDDVEAGDPGQPADEVFEEIRKKYSL